MDYLDGTITIIATVDPDDYFLGDTERDSDYLQLHGDGQSGSVDWDSPVSVIKYPINQLPVSGDNRALTVRYAVATPGLWSFAVGAYDDIGNIHSGGVPAEVEVFKTLTPVTPFAPELVSYDSDNNILTLGL